MITRIFERFTDLVLAGGPVRLYSRGDPDKPPVLLLHGAMLDTSEFTWQRVAPAFAQTHHVYAIDLPRHGASRPWSGTIDQGILEFILDELLDYLGLETIALVGLSLGAGIAIGYSLTRPHRVSRAVLCAPGGLGARRQAQFITWLFQRTPGALRLTTQYLASAKNTIRKSLSSNLAAGEFTPSFDTIVALAIKESELKARFEEDALDDWQVLSHGPFAMRQNFLPALNKLAMPTLWLRGADDPLVLQPEMEQAITATSNSRLEVVEHAKHMLPLDQPEIFTRLTTRFLAENE